MSISSYTNKFWFFCFYSSAISPKDDPEVLIHDVAFHLTLNLGYSKYTQLEITHH